MSTLVSASPIVESLQGRGYAKLMVRVTPAQHTQLQASLHSWHTEYEGHAEYERDMMQRRYGGAPVSPVPSVALQEAGAIVREATKTTILSNKMYATAEHFPLLAEVGEHVMRMVKQDLDQSGGLDAATYTPEHDCTRFQRFLYYGRERQVGNDDDAVVLGGSAVPSIVCPEHTDKGLLTLVVQGGALGLEVFDQSTGFWVMEDSSPPEHVSVTVLVGHTLEKASNRKYTAARHRVVSATNHRSSLVCKLYAEPSAWLSACGMHVDELLRAFEATHQTVNPQPAEGGQDAHGAGAGSGLTVRHAIVNDALPKCTVLLKRLSLCSSEDQRPIAVGPLIGTPSATKFPLLFNSYFYLWALQWWSAQNHVFLDEGLKGKILGMIDTPPTTIGEFAEMVVTRYNEIDGRVSDDRWTADDLKILRGPSYDVCSRLGVDELAIDKLQLSSSIDTLNFILYKGNGGCPQEHDESINIQVVTQDGSEIFFRLRMGTDLFKLMLAFCHRQGVSIRSVRFIFDGQRLYPGLSPWNLEMEDGDVIDVMVEQQGD